jgi:CRP-like cAMP-binding protein
MPLKRTNKDQRIELLNGVDLLSKCSKNELRQIASLTTEIDVPAGKALTRQGEPGREFFIIVDGTAEASRNGITLATLSPTDFFGELALLDGGERTATVVARSDLHILVLTRGVFRELYRSHPSVAQKMLEGVGARLRRADELLGENQSSDSFQLLTL